MRGLDASGNTPTRRATARLVNQFLRRDANAPVKLQCQKNAGMLFTDGYTNESPADGAATYWNVGDVDGVYPAPYGGGTGSSNTIADYAMYGYVNNLRSDLPAGKVPVPNACRTTPIPNGMDCNTNPHMNFYGITWVRAVRYTTSIPLQLPTLCQSAGVGGHRHHESPALQRG
ncbi:hypothetical protein H1235_05220 [Pseudoxanthomonas sp. NC8]|nr:hypothetical protein H1235_05220 [Pseudoxanthomonas sp. NC8]